MGKATATINYMAPLDQLVPKEPPFRYLCPPPPGRPESNDVVDPHEVAINDIRTDPPSETGLSTSGFDAWLSVPTSFMDWDDDSAIKEKYYEDTLNLLKEKLGATRVIIFDHTIRRRDEANDDQPDTVDNRQPVYRAHIDQTPAAGRSRVLLHAGKEEGERLLRTRCQIINVWRPLRGPVVDAPLALCDARSVDSKDLAVSRLIYSDWEGSTYMIHYNPDHKWYYWSNMQPHEVVVIKCYDNKAPHGSAPHTGFTAKVPPGVQYQPRQSIELRCLVFYENEPV